MIDGIDETTLSRGKFLGAAIALSRHLKIRTTTGASASSCRQEKAAWSRIWPSCSRKNSGKFELHQRTRIDRLGIEQAGLKTIISAHAVAKRLEAFSLDDRGDHLDELLPK